MTESKLSPTTWATGAPCNVWKYLLTTTLGPHPRTLRLMITNALSVRLPTTKLPSIPQIPCSMRREWLAESKIWCCWHILKSLYMRIGSQMRKFRKIYSFGHLRLCRSRLASHLFRCLTWVKRKNSRPKRFLQWFWQKWKKPLKTTLALRWQMLSLHAQVNPNLHPSTKLT